MARLSCSKCGTAIPASAWSCPACEHPVTEFPEKQTVSARGMWLLLLLFVAFPVLLFLIHIFVPGM
jgi:hypothetical protein